MLEACLSVALGPAKLAGLISMVACVAGGGLQKEQRALRRSRGPSVCATCLVCRCHLGFTDDYAHSA